MKLKYQFTDLNRMYLHEWHLSLKEAQERGQRLANKNKVIIYVRLVEPRGVFGPAADEEE